MDIKDSVFEAVGNTPLVKLDYFSKKAKVNIFAKIEYYGPTGSIKDRIASYILNKAISSGKLKKDSIIVEATTGNTGIAFAAAAARYGLQMIVVMPEGMSEERKKMLEAYGAELIFTPGAESDIDKTLLKVSQIAESNPRVFLPAQYSNEDNVKAHELTTGKEIIQQTDGNIDAFVCAIGTGGTFTGIGRALKSCNKDIKLFAVEPEECPLISKGICGTHRIEGVGDGIIPSIFDKTLVARYILVSDKEALAYTRLLIRKEGIFGGISSGCNIAASVKAAKYLKQNSNLVTIIPDTGQRYFTTDLFK